MSEDKEKKTEDYGASVRVPSWIVDELEEKIRRHPRGARPTRGELLERAWMAYKEGSTSASGLPEMAAVPKRYEEEVEKFIKILQSGDVTAIKAVIANVNFFLDRLRPQGTDDSK